MGGDDNMLGVVFGIYDGLTIIVAPLMALIADYDVMKYRTIFLLSIVINIIGNLLYSLAYVFTSWIMILLGRIVAGFGASTLPLIIVFIAKSMIKNEQITAVGYVKYTSALSRVMGPIIGIVLSLTKLDYGVINIYTLSGWIPSIFGVITLIVIKFCWKILVLEYGDDHILIPNNTSIKPINILVLIIRYFWHINILGFFSTFIYWYFMGNSFLIATHYFHIVHNEHQLGRLYYAGLGAFVLAFIIFIKYKKIISGMIGLCVSILILGVFSYLYLFNYGVDVIYYIANGVTTFAYALLIPSINVQNNGIAKRNNTILGKYMGFTITLLTVSQSLARFAGPSMFILLKHVNDDVDCDLHNKDNYVLTNCVIDGFVVSSALFASISFVVMIVCSICLLLDIRMQKKYNNPV